MGIFSRNKKEEEIEEVEEIKKKKPRKAAPRGKANKKEIEERKPWSKHDRYFVLIILLGTIIISGILAMYARSWKLPNVPRVTFPEGAFEETFVLEKQVSDNQQTEIINKFKQETNNLSGVYGFKIINLVNGESYGYLNSEEFQAASLIKLPLITLVLEESEEKKLNLESIHTLKAEDKIGGSGSLQYSDEGEIYSLLELVELMGKQSDNTAFNILVNKIGEDNFQNYISEIGMRNTFYDTNLTTIDDIALFFKKLYENRLVNEESKTQVFEFLRDTQYEEHLPAGLPEGVETFHKFGRELHVVNDGGIVFGEEDFVMVILTKGVVEKEADEVFSNLVQLLYSNETNR